MRYTATVATTADSPAAQFAGAGRLPATADDAGAKPGGTRMPLCGTHQALSEK